MYPGGINPEDGHPTTIYDFVGEPVQKEKTSKPNPRAQVLLERRVKDHADTLTAPEVVRAMRDHVERMRTKGASSLPSAVILRAAELLDELV